MANTVLGDFIEKVNGRIDLERTQINEAKVVCFVRTRWTELAHVVSFLILKNHAVDFVRLHVQHSGKQCPQMHHLVFQLSR